MAAVLTDTVLVGPPEHPKEARWDPTLSIPDFDLEFDEESAMLFIEETFAEAEDILNTLCEEYPGFEPSEVKFDGFEVGDDRADVSNAPHPLALMLAVQSKWFGMETSWKDSSISKRHWNLCEVTSVVPTSTCANIAYAKVNGFDKLQFVDSPPLRIVIDVQKGDRGHSSSAVGKASMLGSRTRSANPVCKPIMELSSWFQDTMLETTRSPEPKYMPWCVGGSSAPGLWGSPRNTYLYMNAYKGGTYQRVYGSAINELRNCVSDLDSGLVTQPVLSSRLRMRQDYLHITYADNVAVPRIPLATPEGGEVVPIYRALGGSSLLQGVENRLIQARKLVPESGATAKIRFAKMVNESLFSGISTNYTREAEKLASRKCRDAFDGALRANAAVCRLLQRNANRGDMQTLADQGFLIAGFGVTSMSYYDAKWIDGGGKGVAFTMSDLLLSEDMYLSEELEGDHALKVRGIPLCPAFVGRPNEVRETVSRQGLWQVSGTMLEWSQQIVERLKEAREGVGNNPVPRQDVFSIFNENREWVSDDSLIVAAVCDIAKERTSGTVVLVSTDKRLARVAARTSGLPVALLHPLDLVKNTGRSEWSATDTVTVREAFSSTIKSNKIIVGAPPVIEVIIDTGSMRANVIHIEPSRGGFRILLPQMTGIVSNSSFRYDTFRVKKLRSSMSNVISVSFPNGVTSTCPLVRTPEEAGRAPSVFDRIQSGLKRFSRRR